jgi:hypothetical protein
MGIKDRVTIYFMGLFGRLWEKLQNGSALVLYKEATRDPLAPGSQRREPKPLDHYYHH